MNNIDRAAALIEAMIEHDVEILAADPADTRDRTHGPGAIVQALADAGLLAPEPQIIRTADELAALHPDSLVLDCTGHLMTNRNRLPAVVIATGDQVRAARQSLKEEE